MTSGTFSPRVWLVDPISYSGMAYSDVGQIVALREMGARPLLVGSDSWMLEPRVVPMVSLFRGTHDAASRLRRGARYLRSLARLLRLVRKARPDVVHWQFSELPVADLATMLAIRSLGIPQAYTAHELLPWTASRHHRWLFSYLYRVVDAIVVHSEDQRTDLIDRFPVRPRRIHVAPLGDYALFAAPELPQAEARAKLGIPADKPVALFFGAIRPSKGLAVLLRAWAAVIRESPEAMLLVTGKPYKGSRTGAATSLIAELGIGDHVRTRFEQVDPVETNLYYRAADVVVLPYHAIGTSGVLRYAYNSARPVIATSVGEHRTRILDGRTGRLVPPGDPTALAASLVAALADRPALRLMGAAARAYADAEFRWRDSAGDLLRMYRVLIDDAAVAGPGRRTAGGAPDDQSSTAR